MATTRIKDLSTATPSGSEYMPFDSASGGTRKNTLNAIISAIGAALGFGSTTKDDFFDGAAWWVNTSSNGTAKHFASLTAQGFPSSGVVQLKATTDATSTAEMARLKHGCVLGTSKNIIQTWRVCPIEAPAAAGTGDISFGLLATDGTDGVLLNLSRTSSTDTWQLGTTSGGVTSTDALTVAAGTYYEFRLTVSTTGTVVEVAVDGGAFSTILTGAHAPAAKVYAPYAKAKNSTGSGKVACAFDFVDTVSDRTALSPGTFVDDNAPFGALGISAATPAAVGTSGSAGSSGRASASDHVHAITAATIIAAMASAGSDLSLNSHKLTSVTDPTSAQDAATKAYVDGGTISIVSKSASFTLATSDRNIHCDTSGGAITVTLYSPGGTAREHFIKKTTGSNKITIAHGSVNVEGAAADLDLPGSTVAPTSSSPQAWRLYTDGTDWWIA